MASTGASFWMRSTVKLGGDTVLASEGAIVKALIVYPASHIGFRLTQNIVGCQTIEMILAARSSPAELYKFYEKALRW